MKNINWLDHFINLFVVIIGISVAYALNNLNESTKVENLQKTYVQSMIDDLDVDLQDLDSMILQDKEDLIIFQRVMAAGSHPLSNDSSALALSRIASMSTFNSRNITYESIKSSGKFELLDLKLRIDIIEFYHHGYDQINEIEEYYKNNFDNQIIPILLQSAFNNEANGSAISEELNYDFLKKDGFRTILALHISFLTQKIQAYQNGYKLALKLEKELKANL